MNPTTEDSMSHSRRIGAISLVVFLSLVLPLVVVARGVMTALGGKPLGYNLAEYKDYESGVLKNDELWLPVYRPPHDEKSSAYDCRIKRLDLKTKVESETGLNVGNDVCRLIQVEDQLLAVGERAIYQCEQASLTKIGMLPRTSTPFHVGLFAYEGRLTTVREMDDGGFRLRHLVEGEWVDGREILLPSPDRVWYDDPQSGRRKLLPLACLQPSKPWFLGGPNADSLSVIADRQQVHLVLRCSRGPHSGTYGYRNGFEFADQTEATASALRPENSSPEVSGWEEIPLNDGENWGSGFHDQHGLYMASWNHNDYADVLWRNHAGNWSRIGGSIRDKLGYINRICVDTATGTAWLIDGDHQWSFARFFPLERDSILPTTLTVSDGVREYLARWRILLVAITCAWLVHQIVLAGGIQLLSRRRSGHQYHFGLRNVELASATRRALAISIDALLLLSVLACLFLFQLHASGYTEWPADIELCRILWGFESCIRDRVSSDYNISGEPNVVYSVFSALEGSTIDPALITNFVLLTLLLSASKLILERWFGFTPAKWLLGIRTVRSTLRPCEFSRVLVREALYGLDILFFVTAIPAAISMMLSRNSQRLGDRLADTVVVTVGSLNENQPQDDGKRLA